jgi:protoporphyrinogen oxidase
MTSEVTILGSGMAGLGAAYKLRQLGVPAVIFDKRAHAGGHTSSHVRTGFIFDEGPHVSFTRNDLVRELFAEAVCDDFQRVDAYIDNYFDGRFVRHPVITNMYGMASDLVSSCIKDFVEAKREGAPPIQNYRDWLYASYGKAYAEYFPMRYTRKYHTTDAVNLTTDWVGPRLYQASLDEVLRGALAPGSPNIHYVQDYRYPTHGGFAAFLARFVRDSEINLNHEVIRVDPKARVLQFASGSTQSFARLVSSIPLPDLVPMIAGAPQDVLDAARNLACTTVVLVNLGVNRSGISRSSWTYFYDDVPFSRVSYPANYSPYVAPPGMSSIQAEVYFSEKYKPLQTSPDSCIEPVIAGLQRCGILHAEDQIVLREAMMIKYANIIFDHDREPSLKVVHAFLDDIGIAYCGRYGEWGYLWSDEAFVSGSEAAAKAVARVGA